MKQKLNAVLNDDRGVSPVIGVILMVAITVILAAVIGTFVLGLGDSLQQAPQSQLNAETTGSPGTQGLEISHNGGDSINAADIQITVDGADNNPYTNSGTNSFTLSDEEFNVGDSITISSGDLGSPDGDTQVQLIHTPSESIIMDTEVTFDDNS